MSRQRRSRPVVSVLALALVLGACGGGGGDDDPSPSTSSTAGGPPTSAARTDLAPLTGLVQPDVARRSRVALVVKIDNAPKARPQAGVNQADIVVSEKVEDGVTRLFAVFQSTDAEPVGPIRSARTTDIALVAALAHPLYSYSGVSPLVKRHIAAAPLVDVGFDTNSGDYRRERSRPVVHSLMSTTAALYRKAPPDAKPPPPWFTYRAEGAPTGVGAPAAGVHIEYTGKNITTVVDYRWDAGSGTWKRAQDATPFVDAAGTQVGPRNVVVQFVNYRDTGEVDRSRTAVPEAELVGEGEAWVYTDGKVVEGRWRKAGATEVTVFTDAKGAPIALTPGQTWIELAVKGSARRL
ncbi:MAG TPA: DUF3048 domain-containing protein [Acidimicrobiales bacterium]|nr:DUF3048 domain-containing protein [Acidimicrobiales bacterium]